MGSASGVDVETMPGTGVGQGHQDQFVAEMVEWDVPLDTKWKVNDKAFTFADFCRYSKERASVTKDQELSWAIVIVSKHFVTDHRWTNIYGENLSLEGKANRLSQMIRMNLPAAMQGLVVVPIFAGFDEQVKPSDIRSSAEYLLSSRGSLQLSAWNLPPSGL